jgi:hypothetical protein
MDSGLTSANFTRKAATWRAFARDREPGIGAPMKAGTITLTVVLVAMLGFVVWGFFAAWKLSGPVKMSIHGYVALGLAGGVTLLLGGGLMWLAFYSANKGWDDIDRDEE